jgi:ribonuclease P protein component
MNRCRRFSALETLKKNFEFKRARDKGASYKEGIFVLTVYKNDIGRHRLGLSVGSSKIALASGRNRLKRMIKEVIRTNRPGLKNGTYDIVVSVRRSPGRRIDYPMVEKTLLGLLKRARAL